MDGALLQDAVAIASGTAVGLSLGLVGGGGSILAVPLLYYAVGIGSPHHAIGTSAAAVAATAVLGLVGHARAGTVRWPCALTFAIAGVAGAAAGAAFGKALDGDKLLALFGFLMIAVGVLMFRPRVSTVWTDVHLDRNTAPRLLPALAGLGLLVGFTSGFFGIGGGFLIVPGLIGATAMPILNAVGSSLVSVAAFGATTAASYAISGLVDWWLAGLFVVGGIIGSFIGTEIAKRVAVSGRALSAIFAIVLIAAGIYVALRGIAAWAAIPQIGS
jgi:uncharacterized membrane protein YfcA